MARVLSLPSHIRIGQLAKRLKPFLPHSRAKKLTPKKLAAQMCEHQGRQQYSLLNKGKEYLFPTLSSVIVPYEAAAHFAKGENIEFLPEQIEPRLGSQNYQGKTRLPVVVVLGHVNYGKTTLLDALRGTNVASEEVGGITQGIKAVTVNFDNDESFDQSFDFSCATFIDTPGHEHFRRMRASGALAADVALVLVAANETPGSQTFEALHHAKEMNLPVVIALSKMDMASESQAENTLAALIKKKEEYNDNEDWNIVDVIPISSTTGVGLKELKQSIRQCAIECFHEDSTVEMKDNEKKMNTEKSLTAEATALNVTKSRKNGTLLHVIVRDGVIKEGDYAVCGLFKGCIRFLLDDNGNRLKGKEGATPGMLVKVAGLKELKDVNGTLLGESFLIGEQKYVDEIHEHRSVIHEYDMHCVTEDWMMTEDEVMHEDDVPSDDFCVAIKAENGAALQTILDAMEKIDRVNVIWQGVGNVTKKDEVEVLQLGITCIETFNVKQNEKCSNSKVKVRNFNIMSELIDAVEEDARI
eukprot:g3548.t1